MLRWCISDTDIDEIEFELSKIGESTEGSKSDLVFRLIGRKMMIKSKNRQCKMRVYCFNDRHKWGKRLIRTIRKVQDIEYKLVKDPEEVIDEIGSFVFVHPDHLNNRERDKEVIKRLSERKEVGFLPSIRELQLYDEKIAQSVEFEGWLPETWIFYDMDEAENFLKTATFPLVSKSNEGAGSSNVRLLNSKEDAFSEIKDVFSGSGIERYTKPSMQKTGVKNFQSGYVLWQEFLPSNAYDWRVVIVGGRFAWVLKRFNREDLPFASGSGKSEPITEMNDEINEILTHTFRFVSEFSFNFAGVDLVRDKQGNLKILETTTGWGEAAYPSRVFMRSDEGTWVPTVFKGEDQMKIASLAMISSSL